jgi:hypothetical protein
MRGIERLAHVLRGEKWAYLCDFADSPSGEPLRDTPSLKRRREPLRRPVSLRAQYCYHFFPAQNLARRLTHTISLLS